MPAAGLGGLAAAEIDAALSFAEQEKSEGTRRAYCSDRRIFTAWCRARNLEPLPARPQTIARFLSAEATAGLKASTISRRCAAIGYAHKLAGEPPCNAETMKVVMRGIRRTIGTASAQREPATADLVGAMLKHCPDTLAGKRDRALLALGFAGAFRRSELVTLSVEDSAEVTDGLRVTIRRSKTDHSLHDMSTRRIARDPDRPAPRRASRSSPPSDRLAIYQLAPKLYSLVGGNGQPREYAHPAVKAKLREAKRRQRAAARERLPSQQTSMQSVSTGDNERPHAA